MPSTVTTPFGTTVQQDAYDAPDQYNASASMAMLRQLMQNSAAMAGIKEQGREFDTQFDPAKNPELGLEQAQAGNLENQLATRKSFQERAAAGDPTLLAGVQDPQARAMLTGLASMGGDPSSYVPQLLEHSANQATGDLQQAEAESRMPDPIQQQKAKATYTKAIQEGAHDASGGLSPLDPTVAFTNPDAATKLNKVKALVQQTVGASGASHYAPDANDLSAIQGSIDDAVSSAQQAGADPIRAKQYVLQSLNDPSIIPSQTGVWGHVMSQLNPFSGGLGIGGSTATGASGDYAGRVDTLRQFLGLGQIAVPSPGGLPNAGAGQ